MAEGLLRHIAGDRFDVASAGVSPTHVRPEAITAMREIGIDISSSQFKIGRYLQWTGVRLRDHGL
jgi:arsenate reductase